MTSSGTYCVYFTFYSGNKLPPFYIGSSLVSKVQNGYHGTVVSRRYKVIWNEELKRNPDRFKTRIIRFCDTIIEARARESDLQKKLGVVKSPMYINMAVASANEFAVDGPRPHDVREKISRGNKGKPKSIHHRRSLCRHSEHTELEMIARYANTPTKELMDEYGYTKTGFYGVLNRHGIERKRFRSTDSRSA